MSIKFDVVSGREGYALYANDYRVAGPKPWAGGSVIHTFIVEDAELKQAITPGRLTTKSTKAKKKKKAKKTR